MIKKIKLIGVFILVFFLSSCNNTNFDEITPKVGIYIHKKNQKPVRGRVISFFENGKLSCEATFEDGIPVGDFLSYGYQGEKISISKHTIIKTDNNEICRQKSITRLTISHTDEGENDVKSQWEDLFIVFEQKIDLNNESSKALLLELNKSFNLEANKFENVYFCIGEYDPPFYEIKYHENKK